MPEDKPVIQCNRGEFILLRVFANLQNIKFEYKTEGLGIYTVICPNQETYRLYLNFLKENYDDE